MPKLREIREVAEQRREALRQGAMKGKPVSVPARAKQIQFRKERDQRILAEE